MQETEILDRFVRASVSGPRFPPRQKTFISRGSRCIAIPAASISYPIGAAAPRMVSDPPIAVDNFLLYNSSWPGLFFKSVVANVNNLVKTSHSVLPPPRKAFKITSDLLTFARSANRSLKPPSLVKIFSPWVTISANRVLNWLSRLAGFLLMAYPSAFTERIRVWRREKSINCPGPWQPEPGPSSGELLEARTLPTGALIGACSE